MLAIMTTVVGARYWGSVLPGTAIAGPRSSLAGTVHRAVFRIALRDPRVHTVLELGFGRPSEGIKAKPARASLLNLAFICLTATKWWPVRSAASPCSSPRRSAEHHAWSQPSAAVTRKRSSAAWAPTRSSFMAMPAGGPVDVVLDGFGGELLGPAVRAPAPGGRLVALSPGGGKIDAYELLIRSATVVGLQIAAVARNLPDLYERWRADIWQFHRSGALRSTCTPRSRSTSPHVPTRTSSHAATPARSC